jgi:predicted transposase YdaD
MCKIIEDMREEAREQGRIEGKAEGKIEGALSTLIDLVKKGLLTPAQAVVYTVPPGFSLNNPYYN